MLLLSSGVHRGWAAWRQRWEALGVLSGERQRVLAALPVVRWTGPPLFESGWDPANCNGILALPLRFGVGIICSLCQSGCSGGP